MAALPLTANTIKAGISGAPRPARERPLGTALVLVDLSLSWAFQDKCYYPASPQQTTSAAATSVLPTSVRSSALKQNMRENLFDLRENDHFFSSMSFCFEMEAQGGVDARVLMFLLEGVKNGTIGAVISSSPVRVRCGRGEMLGELQELHSAEPRAVCLETGLSQATFFGLPQNKLLHIGCTILAARCSHDELQTKHFSPLPQHPLVVFILPCCFLSDVNLGDTVCFMTMWGRAQPLQLREK